MIEKNGVNPCDFGHEEYYVKALKRA